VLVKGFVREKSARRLDRGERLELRRDWLELLPAADGAEHAEHARAEREHAGRLRNVAKIVPGIDTVDADLEPVDVAGCAGPPCAIFVIERALPDVERLLGRVAIGNRQLGCVGEPSVRQRCLKGSEAVVVHAGLVDPPLTCGGTVVLEPGLLSASVAVGPGFPRDAALVVGVLLHHPRECGRLVGRQVVGRLRAHSDLSTGDRGQGHSGERIGADAGPLELPRCGHAAGDELEVADAAVVVRLRDAGVCGSAVDAGGGHLPAVGCQVVHSKTDRRSGGGRRERKQADSDDIRHLPHILSPFPMVCCDMRSEIGQKGLFEDAAGFGALLRQARPPDIRNISYDGINVNGQRKIIVDEATH